MGDPDRQAKIEARLLIICPLALIFSFLTSLARTGERQSELATALSLGIPIVVTICTLVIGMRVLSRIAPGESGRGRTVFFIVIGLLAGSGTLFLRLTAGARAEYQPTPRFGSAATSTGAQVDEAAIAELAAAVKEWYAAIDASAATRWREVSKRNMAALRQLELEELRAYRAAGRAERDAVLRVEALVTKLESAGNLIATKRELEARRMADPGDLDPKVLRLLARTTVLGDDLNALMEANWDEWRAHGLPAKESATLTWQKEAHALLDEMLSLRPELLKAAK